MVAKTFQEQNGHTPENIRKILEMAIFVKPKEEADTEITKIWTVTDGLIVPPGYIPVGVTTKDDGASWSRDQETSDTTSHGYSEPTRSDIVGDRTGLAFTMQESKRTTMELFHGIDLTTVTTDADGNFFFDKASRPVSKQYRVLAIGKDGDGPDAIYVARWLPDAKITENGEQAWAEGDEVKYPATFSAKTDKAVGTSFREIWGGPGLDHEAMGFPAPAGP